MSLATGNSCRRQVCCFGSRCKAYRFCRASGEMRDHVRVWQTMDDVVPLAALNALLAI